MLTRLREALFFFESAIDVGGVFRKCNLFEDEKNVYDCFLGGRLLNRELEAYPSDANTDAGLRISGELNCF